MVAVSTVKNILYGLMLSGVGIEFTQQDNDLTIITDDGLVPAYNISREYPDTAEDLPALVYRSATRALPINNASASPDEIIRDAYGDVVAEVYRDSREMQFTVTTRASDAQTADELYEAVYREFEQYAHRDVADVKDLHEDFFHLRVEDADDASDENGNLTMRGESFNVILHFHRTYEVTGDNITSVSHGVEGNNYTTGN